MQTIIHRRSVHQARTYIEEHDVSVRKIGFKGGSVVDERGTICCDGAAFLRALRRRRLRQPRNKTLYLAISVFTTVVFVAPRSNKYNVPN